MRPLHEYFVTRLLHKLADALCDRPWHFLIPQILLFLACVAYTVTTLEFSTSRGDLVSAEERHQRLLLEFQEEFRFPDSLVAIVESDSQERNRRFAERLAARILATPEFFTETIYRGDLQLMGPKALLFSSEDNLDELRDALRKHWPFIETFSRANSLISLFEEVNRRIREAGQAEAIDAEELEVVLPALQRIVNEASHAAAGGAVVPAPGVAATFGEQSRIYLTFAGGKIYTVVTHVADGAREADAIRKLRQLLHQTQMEVPGVNVGLTGEPVLNHDEMAQARRDVSVAAAISLALVALIFIYSYREIRRPLLATICLLVGIGYTLGLATLTVGRLNLLSITLVPILIGLSIDFGIHLITRYEEELRRGRSQRRALRKALGLTGTGIFTTGLTMAGAFFAMLFTGFKGIQEMGFIAGTGLLVCLLPMMTLLPLLLVRGKPDLPAESGQRRQSSHRARIEQIWSCRPKLVLLAAAALTAFSLSQFSRLTFDHNLLNLQSEGLPAVEVEEKLIRYGSQSLLYAAVIADSLEHGMELEERLRKLPEVASITSMIRHLSEDQERKLERVRHIKQILARLDLSAINTDPVDVVRLNRVLFSLQGYLGLAIGAAQSQEGGAALEQQFRATREAVIRLRLSIVPTPGSVASRLGAFQQELFSDFHETVETILKQEDRERLHLEDLPKFLRERFVSATGRFLLQVYPAEDVWNRPEQERFVESLRTIDPNVTGSVVQIYEYTSRLRDSFPMASSYAAGMIALLVLFHFRRPATVFLAFVPVLLGICWMLGLMGALGIAFNPVNILTLTLVIGIGTAHGIHILNRYAEEPHSSILAKSTGKAVVVSGFTSIAGFGSLMAAKHQGIASLGQAMVIGTGMCMLAALTVLPAVLNLLSQLNRNLAGKKRLDSSTKAGIE